MRRMIDRTGAKNLVESLLVGSGACRLGTGRVARRSLVLGYHNVIPHGQGDAGGEQSLHLPQAEFAAQLDRLLETHEIVPLEGVHDSRSRSRPRVAITFDDAYRGAVTAGVAELKARGIPATIFVSPGLLGAESFWWDAIAHEGQVAIEHRDHAIRSLAGRDPDVREWAHEVGLHIHPLPSHARPAVEPELEEAASTRGITLGSHGWNHLALPYLSASELRTELKRPFQWLRERFTSAVPWISYPYGETSQAVEAAAGSAGYRGGLRISGGWIGRNSTNPLSAPRLNVPSGLSLNGFRLRASGLLVR
jgi:peptidoglycan/xylan/chitin deacetylase (PgdA/CDA1 family)